MQIQGNTFFVTGAASGLGAGVVRALVAAGGRVLLADVDAAAGAALAAELGPAAELVRTDVTSENDVQRAIDAARQSLGPLSGVVQCAGILGAARIVGKQGPHDLALFRRVVEVNLIGTFNVLRLAAAAMSANQPNAEGERGVIINTASVAAMDGQIGQAAYAASKGGVASLTLPAARELARVGIRVVAIAPGVFETPMMSALAPEAQAALAAQVPFPPRLGRPAEFAALVRAILENPMLNGTVVRIDGAMRMAAK
ncbi:MAG TPA: SDR family NAD(P)-dependent oxidoreductase [Pirellulales bacterium]|jgi:NAD(P)-dependent dehydrogenase (short-subunit alcohol dehydrogenase family)|nr:SDR family NAD(P)-dependent oxidoreductase [Pirellulales bacterium]